MRALQSRRSASFLACRPSICLGQLHKSDKFNFQFPFHPSDFISINPMKNFQGFLISDAPNSYFSRRSPRPALSIRSWRPELARRSANPLSSNLVGTTGAELLPLSLRSAISVGETELRSANDEKRLCRRPVDACGPAASLLFSHPSLSIF